MPISGTAKLHRLEENFGTLDVELTADDLRGKISVHGDRYPAHMWARVGR